MRLVLATAVAALALAVGACGTQPASVDPKQTVPTVTGETPVAEAKDAAAGRAPEAEPPRESAARTVDGYKRDAARRLYFRNTALLYDGLPPPLLKSIVVLSIRVDAQGKPQRVAVMRSNGFKELEQRAMKSVHDAAPLPVPHAAVLKRGSLEFYETWLFRDDGRFQIRSLAEAQATIAE